MRNNLHVDLRTMVDAVETTAVQVTLKCASTRLAPTHWDRTSLAYVARSAICESLLSRVDTGSLKTVYGLRTKPGGTVLLQQLPRSLRLEGNEKNVRALRARRKRTKEHRTFDWPLGAKEAQD